MPGASAIGKVAKIGGAGAVVLTIIAFAPRIVQWANGPDSYEYSDSWTPRPPRVKNDVTIALTVTRVGVHKARLWADEYRNAPAPVPKNPPVAFSFGKEQKAAFAATPPTALDASGQAAVTIYGTDDSDVTSLHASVQTSRNISGIQTYETVNDPSFTTWAK
jgi:hypothetical protein